MADRHNPELVSIAFRGTPEFKALINVLTEVEDDLSMQETITNCIMDRCKAVGIIDKDGKVVPEYKDDVIINAGIFRALKKERQLNNENRKARKSKSNGENRY